MTRGRGGGGRAGEGYLYDYSGLILLYFFIVAVSGEGGRADGLKGFQEVREKRKRGGEGKDCFPDQNAMTTKGLYHSSQ